MRLHAKLLGNNPFCIFPIWLVYCTFKCTERIKYTLWTGLTSKQFGKSRVVGTLLLSLGLQGCCLPTAAHPNNQNCRNWSPSAKRSLQNRGLNILSCTVLQMSIFSHPVQISQYGTILHLRCDSRQQITRIMANGKKKTTNKQNRERCQVLTSVYFLSYHSLKLLPNAIK